MCNPRTVHFVLTKRTYLTKWDCLPHKSTLRNLSSMTFIRSLESALQQQELQLRKRSKIVLKFSKDWPQHLLVGRLIITRNYSHPLPPKRLYTVDFRPCESKRPSSFPSTSFDLHWMWEVAPKGITVQKSLVLNQIRHFYPKNASSKILTPVLPIKSNGYLAAKNIWPS